MECPNKSPFQGQMFQIHTTADQSVVTLRKPKVTFRLLDSFCQHVYAHPEGGVGLVPKRGCPFTLAYYAFPRWYEFGERRWNDMLSEETRRTRRKTCPSATLSTTNPTWIDQGANPGLRCQRPATNDLSHGMASMHTYRKSIQKQTCLST
jgi:hypothetical protein